MRDSSWTALNGKKMFSPKKCRLCTSVQRRRKTKRNDGRLLAAHVAVAYTASRREDQLHEAVSSRTTIGTALGVLMERYSLDSERAFDVLCRTASETRTKLYVVARQLVETGELPGVDRDG